MCRRCGINETKVLLVKGIDGRPFNKSDAAENIWEPFAHSKVTGLNPGGFHILHAQYWYWTSSLGHWLVS